jgi:Mg/Co/Ni transporter MgtE
MVRTKNVIDYDCIYVVNKQNATNSYLKRKHEIIAQQFEQIKNIIELSESHL